MKNFGEAVDLAGFGRNQQSAILTLKSVIKDGHTSVCATDEYLMQFIVPLDDNGTCLFG
jgi:hypothetical protein